MSFGISVNNLPEQSTTVPSHEQFDGHGTSEKQSPAGLDFVSSARPVWSTKIRITDFSFFVETQALRNENANKTVYSKHGQNTLIIL